MASRCFSPPLKVSFQFWTWSHPFPLHHVIRRCVWQVVTSVTVITGTRGRLTAPVCDCLVQLAREPTQWRSDRERFDKLPLRGRS